MCSECVDHLPGVTLAVCVCVHVCVCMCVCVYMVPGRVGGGGGWLGPEGVGWCVG